MPSRVRRLYDLEIDEVSLVDKPANQHGLVAIAKRAEDPVPTYIDAEGYEVDYEDIEYGETVIDPETGEAFYMATPDEAAELGYEDPEADDGGTSYDLDEDDEFADDGELVGVGKARIPKANMVHHEVNPGAALRRSARFESGAGGTNVRGSAGPGRGTRMRAGARNAASSARGAAGRANLNGAYGAAHNRKVQAGVGGVAAGAAGYGAGRHNASKSLGTTVLEELSKALDNGDRDEVISKMGDMIESANNSAAQAWRIAKSVQAQQEERDYAALAETYELPVDSEYFGGILQSVSKALSPQQLAVLDRVLSASSVGFEELGYGGTQQGDVMGEIFSVAQDAVAKNAGVTEAQAVTALMEANPALYDEYCAENA